VRTATPARAKAAGNSKASPPQPVSQPAINVFADQVVGFHDRPLIEIATPATQEAAEVGDCVLGGVRVRSSRRSIVDPFEQALDGFLGRTRTNVGSSLLSVELAERIAEEGDVSQSDSRRYRASRGSTDDMGIAPSPSDRPRQNPFDLTQMFRGQ
jgi:hypothetical protein